jgi:hypothetical protein
LDFDGRHPGARLRRFVRVGPSVCCFLVSCALLCLARFQLGQLSSVLRLYRLRLTSPGVLPSGLAPACLDASVASLSCSPASPSPSLPRCLHLTSFIASSLATSPLRPPLSSLLRARGHPLAFCKVSDHAFSSSTGWAADRKWCCRAGAILATSIVGEAIFFDWLALLIGLFFSLDSPLLIFQCS